MGIEALVDFEELLDVDVLAVLLGGFEIPVDAGGTGECGHAVAHEVEHALQGSFEAEVTR